jgi:hypothetical protein
MSADFATQKANSGCVTTTTGACTYHSCSGVTVGDGGTSVTFVSAGTLAISGPSLTPPVSITPDSINAYSYSSTTPGFSAGQTLSVTASGGSVPAFGPVSVIAPQLAQVVQPPLATDGGTTNIPTTSDLMVAWTGGQAGAMMILEATANNSSNHTVCRWNGSDGMGIVPAAALQPLSGQSGYFFYGQYNETSSSAGPFAVTLTALLGSGGSVAYQ